jgi:hypothetical protein
LALGVVMIPSFAGFGEYLLDRHSYFAPAPPVRKDCLNVIPASEK